MATHWIGKSEGYVIASLALSATATTLLILKHIDQSTWSAFVQWVWSALVLGGIGKVGFDSWATSKVSGNGHAPVSSPPPA